MIACNHDINGLSLVIIYCMRCIVVSGGSSETIGITLRLNKDVLEAYQFIANKANALDLKNGGRGNMTVQDVIRHRLSSLPLLKRRGK
jgi:hypothetical protein